MIESQRSLLDLKITKTKRNFTTISKAKALRNIIVPLHTAKETMEPE